MNKNITIQQKVMQKLFPAWEQNIPTLGTKYSHVGNRTGLRLAISLLLLLTLGSGSVWGQGTPKVSDGIYYIRNNATNKGYLWPSLTTNATTGYRYLTTSLATSVDADVNTNGVSYPAHDKSYSHWVVKNVTGGYIQLINPRLNKYVVIRKFPKANNTKGSEYGDRDVWLTDEPAAEDIEYTYFVLNNTSSPYKISPKEELNDVSTTSGYTFNSAGGDDREWLTWSKTDNKPQNGEGREGLIQIYSGGKPAWSFTSDLLDAPTISGVDESTNTFTIADANGLPAGYTIRYTTGDGTQDAPTANTGTEYTGPVEVTGNWTVKAVVVRYGIVLTKVATGSVSPIIPRPIVSFDNSTNKVSINCVASSASIYYNTGDGTQADPTISTGTHYENSFDVTSPTTVKAISCLGDGVSSVTTLIIEQIATPTIQNDGSNAISITTATSDATIYYTTDGTNPNTSSIEYTGPLTDNVSNVTIKAIAVKENMITSAVGSGTVKLQCATPVITRIGQTFTLSCSKPTDATLYYTINGGSETLYNGPVPFTADQLPMTVTAVARHSNYTESLTASNEINNGEGTPDDPYLIYGATDFTNFVSNVNNGTTASACYKLASDVSVSGSVAITTEFTGTFDGNGYTISGLSHPLFNTVNGGVVKNVMLDNVHIKQSGNVGAITGEAKGYTRIYNCGILPNDNTFSNRVRHSSVTSSDGYCGGLVGWLKDDSRVINCFSYANVNGGTDVAGIVGHNEAGSTTAVTTVEGKDYYSNLRTAVVNCMFYGNITSGTNRWPVYGGAKMTNKGATAINNYDFYRAEARVVQDDEHYNCSFPAKEEYLTKYEFYRYLLNSNRELCGWWVGAPSAPRTMTTVQVQAVPKDASLIAKWVLDPSIAPYPILKPAGKYFSVINQDPNNRINPDSKTWESRLTSSNTIMTKAAPDTEGQKLGSVTVTIKKGGDLTGSDSKVIPITAMDIDNNDFCYGKIQLPYYNSIFGNPNSSDWTTRYGGNYKDQVVVGWEITSITGGTPGTLVENWQDGYNFADRDCTNKDKERIFAQGGYYYVPNGVSAITITAKWAEAFYLDNGADNSYDRVFMSGTNAGTDFAPAGHRSATLGNGKTVTSGTISSIIPAGGVYEKAIVLVGNHQYRTGGADLGDKNKGCTIISADFNLDDEPDYCLIWQLGQATNRQNICPIRLDFLPVIEMGMAMKEDASTQYYSLGCYLPLGHFEVTETSLIHFGQFEFGNLSRDMDAPLILNGGIFDQYCKGTKAKTTAEDHIDYVILGGNAYMPSFSPGAHVNAGAKYPTRHCAVNVIGGRVNNLYLTGNFNNNVTPNTDDPHCYIDGGHIKHVAAAGKEGIKGDVYFIINHSIIEEFYGGSTLADKLVTGNINVTIDNSKVNKYCGGPKFGNMNLDANNPANNKTITTNATGTTFGVYYGGGNGGTSYVQYDTTDKIVTNATSNYNWGADGKLDNYTPNTYRSTGKNYMADYEMEIVNTSTGTDTKKAVFRTYFYAAQFSKTDTGPVTNILTDCKVLTNFYGGGNLGGVKGGITSTLTNTKVLGSVFGAGYSASVPEVIIQEKDKTAPLINVYTGIITPTPEGSGFRKTYTWTNETSLGGQTLSKNNPAVENVDGKNYFFTEESLENLGTVTGKVTLKIFGTTTVDGNVYGGGEESSVDGDTEVTVSGGTIGTGTAGTGNVFGAGKGLETDYTAALVKGNSTITMTDGTVKGNIYGGGELSSVGTFEYSSVSVDDEHYDASNVVTNCTGGGTTTVTISGGTVGNENEYSYSSDSRLAHTSGGNVFAGSKGVLQKSDDSYLSDWIKFARVKNTVLTVSGGNIMSNIYGGGEIGSVGYLDASSALVEGCGTSVTVSGGIIGKEIKNGDDTQYTFGSVFGGGFGSDLETTTAGQTDPNAPKLFAGRIYGNTSVSMTDGAVKASVYGGGELASVGGNATVTVSGGSVGIPKVGDKQFGGATMGNVYGGGSGNKNIVRAGQIFGNTTVSISQAENKTTNIYHNIYGGGAYGSVGTYTYTYTTDDPNYQGIAKVNGISSCAANTGSATITITGGTIGADGKENGMIFGSSRGDVGAPGSRDDLMAWVNTTNVTIGETDKTGPTIKGSVYGSGENGHTLGNAVVTVHSGTIGIHDGTAADATRGNIYGSGCGTDKYYSEGEEKYDGNGDSYNPKAGIVQGTATVTINGGHVLHNVYGAGAMGPVGLDGEGHNTTVNINGGRIGYEGNSNGNVYGGARGAQGIGRNFAYVGDTEVNINYATTPNTDNSDKTEKLIAGSVFGGGEAGSVHGTVVVNMNKGLVLNDVYGGGALADTNTDNWGTTTTWAEGKTAASNTTTVNLKGGKIARNVYGGGLGQTGDAEKGLEDVEAKVYGNVLVELNNVADDAKGCIVLGSIFGCNNLNGTPMGDVKVHIYKTQNDAASKIAGTDEGADADHQPKKKNRYDVAAVYGGGNQSAYEPADAENNKTEVIIDGCGSTSIRQVYGGGNAACTPATNVTVNGTFEILELFGGGNGLDNVMINGLAMPNPGANVGYKNYSEYYFEDNTWKVRDKAGYDTKDKRTDATDLVYGTGKASVNIFGGTVHRVFGGSNTKGNVRQTAVTLLDENSGCDFCVDEAYGGGKSAPMDAEAKLLMACIPGLQAAYGGAEAAAIQGNVTLNITNGTFDRVFGGNNLSGTINGSITVNIEEVGCKPIIIGELYGGGNLAAYSIYGYNDDGTPKETGSNPFDDPVVNVRSFTSIGAVYGGGYGTGARMIASPTVNINESLGTPDSYPTTGDYDANGFKGKTITLDEGKETEHTVTLPAHTKGKMGAIGDVFGGGNAAEVKGNTTVNVGTSEYEEIVSVATGADVTGYYTRSGEGTEASPYTYDEATGSAVEGTTYYKKVLGADIRGNVYGGGNNAEVTGNTNVNIGKKSE